MDSIDEFERKRITKFLSKISNETNNISLLGKDKLEYIFRKSLDLLNLPLPNGEIYDYFLMPEIVWIFLEKLYYAIPQEKGKDFQNLRETYNFLNSKGEEIIRYRILGEMGSYPGCELQRGDCKYTIVNSIPVLIAKDEAFDLGETLSIPISIDEIRVATCAMLAPPYGFVCFMFTNNPEDYNILTIKKRILNKVPKKLQVYFLHQLLQYENLMKFRDNSQGFDKFYNIFSNPKIISDPSKYNFIVFDRYIDFFNKLFDHFDIKNNLLLKASYYFIKALMLMYSNFSFAEEATANAFFCLEGCMHLIQKKYGINEERLNMYKLQDIFKEKLPRGEELFEYMREFYRKRNELVHAETDWGAEWPIPLNGEDLTESIELCRKLLNFILIDRWIEDEKEKDMEEYLHEFDCSRNYKERRIEGKE
jgi:hypothetical protein